MTIDSPADPGRRETLRWAFGLSVGTLVGPLAGCNDNGPDPTPDTLPEAQVLTSKNGLLSLDLAASYAAQPLTVAMAQSPAYPGLAAKVSTYLRNYNGQYMAPTLVINQGDTLTINLINNLPPVRSDRSSLEYLTFPNSTNLHFHGLHVDPREFRPGVFGDYVVDTAEGGVLPGQRRLHELAIPGDHVGGINWYHPHLHGSSNVQVSSGMFGAILIRNPSDRFITSPEIRERVIFVHKVTLNNDGRVDSFYDTIMFDASAFLLNGAYQPTIVMRPGEVQNWHFINSATFYPFNPLLDGHTLQSYARDGNPFDGVYKPLDTTTSTQFGNQQWPGNAIYPGGRHSVIVKASDVPGTYYLRAVKAPSSEANDEIVARIVVEGQPMSTAMPSPANLPRYADHEPITDAELASHGGKQRNLILAIVPKTDPLLDLPIPAGEEWYIPAEDNVPGFADLVFASGSASAKLAPFQSALTVTQTVALDAVEEWTIENRNGYPHPFHIHINDSYVVKVNGEPVTPFWADTLPVPPVDPATNASGSITFRMRFTDFSGKYVWHCHALDHEDLGMMQLVEVVA